MIGPGAREFVHSGPCIPTAITEAHVSLAEIDGIDETI